jgi:hypothetical protein
MKKAIVLSIAVFVSITSLVSAEVIRDGINIDFVTIGNPGNGTDPATGNLYGAVGYNYRIGKYEVTNAQWNAFTAAAGAPTGNDGGYGDSAYFTGAQQPTNEVSWYEAAQFCNYLTSGDKSKGVYQFSGTNANPGNFLGIDRASSISTYGISYVIPTEDEWYKAAYYKPDGSGYSLYANGTDTAPIAGVQSNYDMAVGAPWDIINGTQEQNGTFDMMGNVWEWNETLMGSNRGLRGGAYDYLVGVTYDDGLTSEGKVHEGIDPLLDNFSIGFRVASVPEPASLLLLALGGILVRKR